MAIISITIINSIDQTLPGIPNTVSVATNIPATIFYTLDGGDPNNFSPNYITPIVMPKNLLTVVLKLFATNGIDSSAIITTQYTAIIASIPTNAGARVPHAAVSLLNNASTNNSLFPFGTNSPNPDAVYLNTGDAGTTVLDQTLPSTSSGFDADGNPAGFTNAPINDFKFKQIYSTVNFENAITPGVGNLPAKVSVIGKQSPVVNTQEVSHTSDKLFNPRALVIFQDSTTEDPTNPVIINRPYFALENTEVTRDGNLLYNTALDSPTTTGSFIKSYHNPRTNEITSYFYDNAVNRWIISTSPYQPTNPNIGSLQNMVFARQSSKIFSWHLFYGRFLI